MTRRTGAASAALIVAAGAALLAASSAGEEGKRWWSHIEALANDNMEGRDTGSEGHRRAAAYVSGEFERLGLAPAGTQGFIQPVEFNVRRIVESGSGLDLVRNGKAEKLALGDDAIISLRTDPAEAVEAPLFFSGYGFAVPEKNFNDLAGADLRGKIIVTMTGAPADIPGPLKAHYQSAAERNPFLVKAGVVGVVAIPTPKTMDVPWSRIQGARLQPSMSLADPALNDGKGLKLGVTVNPEKAERWFEGTGHTAAELIALADAGKPLPHFAIPATLRARTRVERSKVVSQNVAASLTGSDPRLKAEYVVLTAHLDHVGVGAAVNGDRIYNGAMDDASGIASLLEIARMLRQSKTPPKRSMLFVAVTGEEKGLLGSKYFAAHPTVPARRLVADLNLDMFLPLFPLHSVTVYGLNESSLGDTLRSVAKPMGIRVDDDPEPVRNLFVRSDQYSFIRRGIPALAFKVGYDKGSPEEQIAKKWLKERYHAPSDDLKQPVDLEAAASFNRLMMALAEAVANGSAQPHWKPQSFFRRFAE